MSLVRVVIICLASTHTALVSVHLSTYIQCAVREACILRILFAKSWLDAPDTLAKSSRRPTSPSTKAKFHVWLHAPDRWQLSNDTIALLSRDSRRPTPRRRPTPCSGSRLARRCRPLARPPRRARTTTRTPTAPRSIPTTGGCPTSWPHLYVTPSAPPLLRHPRLDGVVRCRFCPTQPLTPRSPS